MRRLVGAWVVAALIGAWNLAAHWLVRPASPPDPRPAPVAGTRAPEPLESPPASAPSRSEPPARGRNVPPSFRSDPFAFLSTAPVDSLDLLPGVGPVLAQRIIRARALRGPFASWDDVLAVDGIGPRTVARWQLLHTRQ